MLRIIRSCSLPAVYSLSLCADGFVVNPSDPQAACGAVPEARQSAAFRHVHPSHVVAGRRRRAAGKDDDDDCVPRSDTPFCEATRDQRDAQVRINAGMYYRVFLGDDGTSLLYTNLMARQKR